MWWDLYVERNVLLNRKCSHFNSTAFTHNHFHKGGRMGSPLTNLSGANQTPAGHEGFRFHLSQGCNMTNWACARTRTLSRTPPPSSLNTSMCPDWSYLYPGWCPILTCYISLSLCVCVSPPSFNRTPLFIWINPKKATMTGELRVQQSDSAPTEPSSSSTTDTETYITNTDVWTPTKLFQHKSERVGHYIHIISKQNRL